MFTYICVCTHRHFHTRHWTYFNSQQGKEEHQTGLEQNVSYHNWVGWLGIDDRLDSTQNLSEVIIYSVFGSSVKYLWCQRSTPKAFVRIFSDFADVEVQIPTVITWRYSLKNNSVQHLRFHIYYAVQYIKKHVTDPQPRILLQFILWSY